VQLLVVRHSVRYFGVGITLSLLPIFSLIGFALLALNPAFLLVAVFQALRRAIGFGFSKPTNDMLYSVVTPEEKYKSKNFIDTAVYRGGDLIGIWTVKALWGLGFAGISLVMLPFALLWGAIAIWLGSAYRQRDREAKAGELA
jgi:AAA family ATP:ADP antiporter